MVKRAPRHALPAVPLSFVAALLVVLAAGLFAPAPVEGATFTVATTGDWTDSTPGDGLCRKVIPGPIPIVLPCSLRAAIMEANALAGADTITLPAGTYALTLAGAGEDAAATGDLDITGGKLPGSLTINGDGAATTIIDGGDLDRVFHVASGTVSISGVTIRNGSAASGGGISNSGSLTLTNSSVSGNTAGSGGGIFNITGGTLAVTNSTVSGNTGSDGGGISNSGSLTLTGSTVSGNTAVFDGGGILSSGAATLTVTNSTVSGNTAAGNGGGILNFGTLTLTNSTVSGNTPGGVGGGILNYGTLTVANSTVSGNTTAGGGGGGIYNNLGGTLTLANSTVSGNTTGGNGGGIYAKSGTVTLTNSTVSGNTASVRGGGIFNITGGTLAVTNSTVSGNTAGGDGGGIRNSGTLTLTNSTVSGNTASTHGGGVYNFGGTVTLTNVTITNNTADSDSNGSGDGGGVARGGGTVNLKNTILGGNMDPSSDPDCFGALTSQGYNLIQTVSAGCSIGGVTTGNVTGQSANLSPLAFNVPGTTQTHALLLGSPAIDAGSPDCPPPAGDQRGVVRPAGNACDIGAYESVFASTPTPTPTPTPTATPIGQTPSPTPIPTPTPTATPIGQTPSPTPTATPIGQTPTPTPTATPVGQTPTPSPASFKKGNVNCDGAVTSVDALQVLRHVAGLQVNQNPGCPQIGGALAAALAAAEGGLFGDVDCDGAVNSVDALKILRYVASLPVSQPQGCSPIDE